MNRSPLRAPLSPLLRGVAPLALVLLLAACGGREEAAGTPAPSASGSGEAAAPTAPGSEAATAAQAAAPALDLSPEEADKLARVAAEYAAKHPKRAPATEIVSPDGSAIALPDGYPSDIPVAADARPVRYASSADAGTMTVIESEQPIDAVRGYYIDELGAQGWTIEGDSTREGLTMIRAAKDDRVITVVLYEEEGISRTVVTWSPE